jgi:hypothetical protein
VRTAAFPAFSAIASPEMRDRMSAFEKGYR